MARVQELGKRVREWCKSCERELRKKDVQAVKWLCFLEDQLYYKNINVYVDHALLRLKIIIVITAAKTLKKIIFQSNT